MRWQCRKDARSIISLVIACVIVALSTQISAKETHIETPSSCTFYGDFQQSKSLRGLEKPIESSGVFFYSCVHGVIWKTLLPIEESLVLNKDGNNSKVENGQVTQLKSRQGKMLGLLINGLIGANTDFIDKNFDVVPGNAETTMPELQNKLNQQSIVLSPKSRRLQRGLTRIELLTSRTVPNSIDHKDGEKLVTISLLDRHQQWTHIVSSKKADYPQATDSLSSCLASSNFSLRECELLEQTQAS